MNPNKLHITYTNNLVNAMWVSNYTISSFFLCLLFLSLTSLCKAQETAFIEESNFTYECDCKNWSDGLSISVGASFNAPQEISNYLSLLNASPLPDETLWLGLGWSFRSEEDMHLFDVLVGLGDASSNNENFKLNYRENDFMLRYYRKVFSASAGSSFGLGVQTSFLLSSLQVTQRNLGVDLATDTFVPNTQNLSNNAWMLGPSLSLNWVSSEKQKLIARVVLSYDFSLYTSAWKVAQATTNASFNEKKDRIQFSLLIPLFTR